MYLGGRRVVLGRPSRPTTRSSGTARPAGRRCRRAATCSRSPRVDLAGNETPPAERKRVVVRIRTSPSAPRPIHVSPGASFTVKVRTGAPQLHVAFAGKHGDGATKRAPPARAGNAAAATGSSSRSIGHAADRDRDRGPRSDRPRAPRRRRSRASASRFCFMARTRENRIAGLGYAGVGTALLARVAAVAERGRAREARSSGCSCSAGRSSWLFRREPWLVAYLALATLPIRVHFLAPPAARAALHRRAGAAAFNLLRELVAGDERSREFGRATKPLALYLLWIGLSMAWTDDIRTRRDRRPRLLRPVHDHRALGRAASVEAAPREAPLRGARRDGAHLRASSASTSTRRGTSSRTRSSTSATRTRRSSASTPSSTTPRSTGASSSSRSCRRPCSRARQVGAGRPRRARVRGRRVARAARLVLAVELLRALRRRLLPLRVRLAVEGARRARRRGHVLVARTRSPRRSSCTRSATTASAEINPLTSGRGSLIYNGLRIAKRHPVTRRRPRRLPRAYPKLTQRQEAEAQRLAQHTGHRRRGGRA